MKQSKQNSGLYNQCLDLLRKPLFRTFANVFSHGATHFVFLFVIGAVTAYLWMLNNQDNITPHNIGVNVDWSSYYSQNGGQGRKFSGDSIPNVSVNIKINSKEIEEQSNNEYHSGVTIEFDELKYVYRNENRDTIQVSLFSEPLLNPQNRKVVAEFGVLTRTTRNMMNPYTKAVRIDTVYNYTNIVSLAQDNYFWAFKDVSDSIIGGYFALPDKEPYDHYKSRFRLTCFSDELGVKSDNPYYYYYVSFPPDAKFSEGFSLRFAVSDSEDIGNSLKYSNKNLQFNYIYPEPDVIGNGRIEYNTDEKKETILKNQGVIIQAVDVDALNNQNRKAFLYSVLVGTGFAFLLDIIIQLIRELSRVQRKDD